MANKKINQLVSKTAILSTDLFGIGDATTGQLFKKTIAELQAAIGGAVISVNGLVGTVVLDTDDIQELATPTNKYFTDARARGAISLTVTGNSGASTYSSGTGVLNVPTYTLAGLGGITATFLSGGAGISYNSTTGVISYSGTVYTDASIRALFSGSTGITYNSSTGAISYSGTVYTDSSVRALISMTTTGDSGASTYNNTTGVINVPNYTLAGLGGISYTSLSGGTGITYNNTTGAISYSGTVYTDASVRALFSGSGSVSYNSSTGVFTSSITQYTDALARASISLTTTGTSGASTYNSTTGVFNIPQYASAFSGTTNYHAKFTSSTTIGNSLIFDNGSNVGLGTTSPTSLLHVNTAASAVGGIKLTSAVSTHGAAFVATNGGGDSYFGRNSNTGGAFTGEGYATVVYSGGAYPMAFYTNDTERIRITSAGNVGIGVTPSSFSGVTGLQVVAAALSSNTSTSGMFLSANSFFDGSSDRYINTKQASRYYQLEGNHVWDSAASGTAGNVVTFTERMRITSAGYVLLGTYTAAATNPGRLIIESLGNGPNFTNNGLEFLNANSASGYGSKLYTNNSNDYFGIATRQNSATWTERFIINQISGNVLINTSTDNGYKLYVSGTIYATGNITANSDLTLKKNLELITNPIDKLMQLNGYSYQWKSDDSHQYGVIAQEVEKILPYAVSTGNDGSKGVSYNQIIPVLIEAVKEQKAKIENLEILLASK